MKQILAQVTSFMKGHLFLLFIFFLLFTSCEKYYLTLKKEYVNQSTLASTYVGSPDPMQKNPPLGEELVIEWWLPPGSLDEELTLMLKIIYRNYTEQTLIYPVLQRRGEITFPLLNDGFIETGGFLSYKVEIRTSHGEVMKEWEHRLWTNLITIESPDF